jgi:hypothetical protein
MGSIKDIPLSLRVVNSFTIELNAKSYVEEIWDNEDIIELSIKDRKIKVYDSMKLELSGIMSLYNVNYIKKVNDSTYLLLTEERNRCTYYILPMLQLLNSKSIKKENLGSATIKEIEKYGINTYLVNAFLGTKDNIILTNSLFLKYRYSPHNSYQCLEKLIIDHPWFIRTHEKDSYTYMEFIIPKDMRKNLTTFLDGQYSKLCPILKENIIKFHGLSKKSIMYQILYQGEDYRKQLEKEFNTDLTGMELESIPEFKNETIEI